MKKIMVLSPYSVYEIMSVEKKKQLIHHRYLANAGYCVKLMGMGHLAMSAIGFGHPASEYFNLPTDWDYWKNSCIEMINLADEVHLLALEGFMDSKGLMAEYQTCKSMGKPMQWVKLMNPQAPRDQWEYVPVSDPMSPSDKRA